MAAPPTFGPPSEPTMRFDAPERCYDLDWADFCEAVVTGRPPEVDAVDCLRTWRLLRAAYDRAAATAGGAPVRSSGCPEG